MGFLAGAKLDSIGFAGIGGAPDILLTYIVYRTLGRRTRDDG